MKKVLVVIFILLIAITAIFFYFKSKHSPQYSGTIKGAQFEADVEVVFDTYGVPHIYANNSNDAYKALGFVHAQDRLFQMEMMRRVGSGSLSEILGEDLLNVDKFFRTLGIKEHAKLSSKEMDVESEYYLNTISYIQGLNYFIENGNLPLEYTLLGVEPRPFTIDDINAITGYVSFSFAMALKTDPLVNKIANDLGSDYLDVLSVHTLPEHIKIPLNYPKRNDNLKLVTDGSFTKLMEKITIAPFLGSNGWVISGERTESGKPILCNDTHIGFAQPSVWYEAHIEYPGYSFYGNHLAGFPFALVGHSLYHAFGLTMFENDDFDFFVEKRNPQNAKQYFFKDETEFFDYRIDTIFIKGGKFEIIEVEISRHGPILNNVVNEIGQQYQEPVAAWWVYLMEPTRALEATWIMNHAKSIQEMESGARLIHAPGLNIMYGDNLGNIAWWATAKLPLRPEHVNSKVFLDGSTGKDEILGWIPFEENPMSLNPESGYVYSANNQPDSLINGKIIPGYYFPGDRASRIMKTLSSRKDWNSDLIKSLQLESMNESHPKNLKIMLSGIENSIKQQNETLYSILYNWNGFHKAENVEPTFYYLWLYNVLKAMMEDELGETYFETFLGTFLKIRSINRLITKQDSPWWDNVNTEEIESRTEILTQSFIKTKEHLNKQFKTDNFEQWKWEKVATLTHPHPLAAKKPLDKIFNVKAGFVEASLGAVNKLDFKLNEEGIYDVKSGPAMRIIVDFGNVDASESILPTGQSGNLFSKHYDDQTDKFAKGEYRPQLMNREMIEKNKKSTLIFKSGK